MPISCQHCRDNWDELLNQAATGSGIVTADSDDISQHVASCAECAAEFKIIRAARRELQALPSLQAPPELRTRLREQLQSEATSQQAAAVPVMQAQTARANQNSWFSQMRRFFQRPANVAWSSGLALAAFCVFIATRNPTTPPLQSGVEIASAPRNEEKIAGPAASEAMRPTPQTKIAPKKGSTAKKPATASPSSPTQGGSPAAENSGGATPPTVPPLLEEPRRPSRRERNIAPSVPPAQDEKAAPSEVRSPPAIRVKEPSATKKQAAPSTTAQNREKQPAAPQKAPAIRVVWLPVEARASMPSPDTSTSLAAESTASLNHQSMASARSEAIESENSAATMMAPPGAGAFSAETSGAPPVESTGEAGATTMLAPAPAPSASVTEAPATARFRARDSSASEPPGIDTMHQLPSNRADAEGMGLRMAPLPGVVPQLQMQNRRGKGSNLHRGGGVPKDTGEVDSTISQRDTPERPSALENRVPAPVRKAAASPARQDLTIPERRARLQVMAPRDIANARIEVLLSNGLRWAQGPDAAQRLVWSGRARAGQIIPVEIAVVALPARTQQLTISLKEMPPQAIGQIVAPKQVSAPGRTIEQRTVALPAAP
jgi:hypothetical protein